MRFRPGWPGTVTALSALTVMGLASQILLGATAHISSQPAPPARPAAMPSLIDHAQGAASAHLFGVADAASRSAPEIAENSPYKVNGIACMGDTQQCDDQQAAVATLMGPGGESVVQTGARLPTGETVTRIDPYAVTLTGSSGSYRLELAIPMASTDERTALLPVEGMVDVHMTARTSATGPEPKTALSQNLTALEAALRAAQARRKALTGKGHPAGSGGP